MFKRSSSSSANSKYPYPPVLGLAGFQNHDRSASRRGVHSSMSSLDLPSPAPACNKSPRFLLPSKELVPLSESAPPPSPPSSVCEVELCMRRVLQDPLVPVKALKLLDLSSATTSSQVLSHRYQVDPPEISIISQRRSATAVRYPSPASSSSDLSSPTSPTSPPSSIDSDEEEENESDFLTGTTISRVQPRIRKGAYEEALSEEVKRLYLEGVEQGMKERIQREEQGGTRRKKGKLGWVGCH